MTPTIAAIEPLLRARLAGTLPGIEAQRRFAPVPARRRWTPGAVPRDTRRAAGLLLLYPAGEEVRVPLTVRAAGLRRHAGQISLPGGATEPDETLAGAALREAHEEIGIEADAVRILGELTPVDVRVSGFTLHPVVGITDAVPIFRPAAAEVEAVVEVSIDRLRDASCIRQGSRIREGVAVDYPYFDLLGHQVWGATAMVLGEFVCLLDEIYTT
ncbi:MAG TPA: CoA pyrophosphatase [Vicinamibacterales bacterium]|nr:CoA pyrophosphatase [Vicinamibacterales bacterium]